MHRQVRRAMVDRLTFDPVHVDPDLILRLQKYRQLDTVPQVVKDVAHRMAASAEGLVEPQGWVWRGPVNRVDATGHVQIGDAVRFESPTLVRVLEGATEVAVVVLTIGPRLERRAHELIGEEQLVEGLLLDTAGWVAIDALLKDTRRRLAADAKVQGRRVTGRMAPGFAGWGLEQQRELFSAFDGAALSVHLTEACVMIPRKSVSGIYGLVPVTHAG
jgi:hypothetical protein